MRMSARNIAKYVSRATREVVNEQRGYETARTTNDGTGSVNLTTTRGSGDSYYVPTMGEGVNLVEGQPVLVGRIEGDPSMKYVHGFSPYTVPTESTVVVYNIV